MPGEEGPATADATLDTETDDNPIDTPATSEAQDPEPLSARQQAVKTAIEYCNSEASHFGRWGGSSENVVARYASAIRAQLYNLEKNQVLDKDIDLASLVKDEDLLDTSTGVTNFTATHKAAIRPSADQSQMIAEVLVCPVFSEYRANEPPSVKLTLAGPWEQEALDQLASAHRLAFTKGTRAEREFDTVLKSSLTAFHKSRGGKGTPTWSQVVSSLKSRLGHDDAEGEWKLDPEVVSYVDDLAKTTCSTVATYFKNCGTRKNHVTPGISRVSESEWTEALQKGVLYLEDAHHASSSSFSRAATSIADAFSRLSSPFTGFNKDSRSPDEEQGTQNAC